MRIIHTADWHMGKRLGFIDRTDDIKRVLRQIAGICTAEKADVLLVCGDLFDGSTRPELVRDWTEFLSATFAPFLQGGGTILALTGNHDNEHLAQVLRNTMQLAVPAQNHVGGLLPPGRMYLFSGPTFFRLADAAGTQVQFVVMPSPTPARYLPGIAAQVATFDEKNRALKTAFKSRLDGFAQEPAYDATKHTVLAAHIATAGADIGTGRSLSESETIVLQDGELPTGYAYVALGDIHRPQMLMKLPHVRYCGSIDRMDLGESEEEKGVVIVDIDANGRQGDPRCVPLQATPIYKVEIKDPMADIPLLAERHPDRAMALVNLSIHHKPGHDNLPQIVAQLGEMFPRHYARQYFEHTNGDGIVTPATSTARPLAETVRQYVSARLAESPDREAVLLLIDELLQQQQEGQ